MTHTRLRAFAPIFLALITALALPSPASGAQVTVTFLTEEGRSLRPLTDKQALYKSPFGGWVVTSWPFSMRVDDTAVFRYQTAEQNLLTQAMEGGPTDSVVEEMLEGTDLEENRVRRAKRSCSVSSRPSPKRHYWKDKAPPRSRLPRREAV